jgi:ATP-dependent DNA helicase RecG
MSATPIPRSLALTVFGDLDASTLRQMPHGRRPVKTKWARAEQDRREAYGLIKSEVAKGRQAFVVCPLIDESEAVEARAATVEYELLSKGVLSSLRVGLLHGRMPLKEKQAAMDKFRARELDVLVATPVIEVGVDIPNATVVLIESADRFGLAQLHQLRGRVGRGGENSYCVLLADEPSTDARERLGIIERNDDGFDLAEEDLRLRGPGDYVGTRQSGWSNLKVATPADFDILAEAREAARGVIGEDPMLEQAGHKLLAIEVKRAAEGRTAEFS